MEDLLKKLKEHLSAMIEEIDNYIPNNLEDIIIKKQDFKHLHHLRISQNNGHLFEYKDGIKFVLYNSYPNDYHQEVYSAIMDGSLEVLILNKRDDYEKDGHIINYVLETRIKTNLRNLYRPMEEEN